MLFVLVFHTQAIFMLWSFSWLNQGAKQNSSVNSSYLWITVMPRLTRLNQRSTSWHLFNPTATSFSGPSHRKHLPSHNYTAAYCDKKTCSNSPPLWWNSEHLMKVYMYDFIYLLAQIHRLGLQHGGNTCTLTSSSLPGNWPPNSCPHSARLAVNWCEPSSLWRQQTFALKMSTGV